MARSGRAAAFALALLVLFAAVAPATEDGWILGRWELIRDPDGNPKDWLEFATDGRMTTIAASGQRFHGQYAVTGSEVLLNYKVGNESILITLTYGLDRRQLYARSARTGNTAVYEKRP
jgi:hypothetical protein